jgi:hypothetical protein
MFLPNEWQAENFLINFTFKFGSPLYSEYKNETVLKLILLLIVIFDMIPFFFLVIFYCRSQWPSARSKAFSLFPRSHAEIVGSNPIQGNDVRIVCVYSVCCSVCR